MIEYGTISDVAVSLEIIENTRLRVVLLIFATALFVAACILKLLSDSLHRKLETLEREHGRLKPCPFCGSIPDVRNGSFLCKKCKTTMYIPFRHYKSVDDMVDQTWNRRWKD